jgi:hypothetical protein
MLDRSGYSLEQVGALIAHTRKGVTAVYARCDKFDLRREMAMVIEGGREEPIGRVTRLTHGRERPPSKACDGKGNTVPGPVLPRAPSAGADEELMPLKGRVGRHASDGRQCRNWKADQQTVIDLLNKIPIADGGTGGTLGGRIVGGLASRALCEAILAFEKKHFPGRVKGFVDPGGAVLAKLEALVNQPPPAPAPKPPNQWDVLTTKSVMQGVRGGLADDQKLNHADAVNIVRSVLSDGTITQREIDDLRAVASTAKSLEPRSKALLFKLATTLGSGAAQGKILELAGDDQKYAAELICKFMQRSGNPCWPGLDRDQVGASLLMRVANPSTIDQNNASLCGPAAVMFGFAADRPAAYANFAIELFDKGEVDLGHNTVSPDYLMRHVNPGNNIDQADWMTLGGLRSSENWFVGYWNTDQELGGITTAWELANWLGDAGYTDVREETNVIRDKGEGNLRGASKLYGRATAPPCSSIQACWTRRPSRRIPAFSTGIG